MNDENIKDRNKFFNQKVNGFKSLRLRNNFFENRSTILLEIREYSSKVKQKIMWIKKVIKIYISFTLSSNFIL